jgi:hypothetical protein
MSKTLEYIQYLQVMGSENGKSSSYSTQFRQFLFIEVAGDLENFHTERNFGIQWILIGKQLKSGRNKLESII